MAARRKKRRCEQIRKEGGVAQLVVEDSERLDSESKRASVSDETELARVGHS